MPTNQEDYHMTSNLHCPKFIHEFIIFAIRSRGRRINKENDSGEEKQFLEIYRVIYEE
jgi:hypothetical protein